MDQVPQSPSETTPPNALKIYISKIELETPSQILRHRHILHISFRMGRGVIPKSVFLSAKTPIHQDISINGCALKNHYPKVTRPLELESVIHRKALSSERRFHMIVACWCSGTLKLTALPCQMPEKSWGKGAGSQHESFRHSGVVETLLHR